MGARLDLILGALLVIFAAVGKIAFSRNRAKARTAVRDALQTNETQIEARGSAEREVIRAQAKVEKAKARADRVTSRPSGVDLRSQLLTRLRRHKDK